MASCPLITFIYFLILLSNLSLAIQDEDLYEDLDFLQNEADQRSHPTPQDILHNPEPLDSEDEYSDEFDNFEDLDESDGHAMPEIDETDLLLLKERNFTTVIENNQYVLVEFYAPWCAHCQDLAPEFAAAATDLKDYNVVLAKVDATEENELAQEYNVQGFPTVLFFVDGQHKSYPGQPNREAIVTWIKKKIGPGITNITTVEDAEQILRSRSKFVLGFLDSLVGPDSNELSAASRIEYDVNFYQTVNAEVAKIFRLNSEVKRPALVLLKNEEEKLSHFDGKFVKSAIAEFVFANKIPLVTIFTKESAPLIFESSIKKQVLMFATSKDTVKLVLTFQEAAKFFKGKLIFVYVEVDNEEVGKPVSEYFGISADVPKVVAYTGNDDGKKFVFDGEMTVDKLKAFGEDFLEDQLKPFYKSDPIPETNDGDVKIVVGDNFDEIVLDESKDVLFEIYDPLCGHCQALEPTYAKLAKHLRGIESLVVAKMDGSTNEHPRAKADGFPTILFFPAGNKSFDPITVDTDRTVVAFYKFLKKHATIPFKIQKSNLMPKFDTSDAKVDGANEKDEL